VPHPSFLRVRILSMRNPLRRYYGRRDLHFVTFRRVARGGWPTQTFLNVTAGGRTFGVPVLRRGARPLTLNFGCPSLRFEAVKKPSEFSS
jgi:hypothetical protein